MVGGGWKVGISAVLFTPTVDIRCWPEATDIHGWSGYPLLYSFQPWQKRAVANTPTLFAGGGRTNYARIAPRLSKYWCNLASFGEECAPKSRQRKFTTFLHPKVDCEKTQHFYGYERAAATACLRTFSVQGEARGQKVD